MRSSYGKLLYFLMDSKEINYAGKSLSLIQPIKTVYKLICGKKYGLDLLRDKLLREATREIFIDDYYYCGGNNNNNNDRNKNSKNSNNNNNDNNNSNNNNLHSIVQQKIKQKNDALKLLIEKYAVKKEIDVKKKLSE
jgi:hypothetical protein